MAKTESAVKHTAGPWEARVKREGHLAIFPVNCPADRVAIAVLDHSRDGHEPTRIITTPADARLIAAAPELLTWLDKIVTILENEPEMWNTAEEDLKFARAAIKKARGE